MTPGPTITSHATEAEIDRNNIKIFILAALGIGASMLSARIFMAFLSDIRTDYFAVWAVSVCVFVTFIMLQTMFVKSQTKLQVIMFLQGIAPTAVLFKYLYPSVSLSLFMGIFASAVFYMIAAHRGWTILANSLSIKFSFIARNTIPKAMTGLLIFSALFSYAYYFEEGNFTEELGRSISDRILISSEPLVEMWFPGVSFSQNGKDFFEKIAAAQLEKIPFEEAAKNPMLAAFGTMPEKEKQKLISEAATKVRYTMEKSFGAFPVHEPVRESIFNIARDWVNRMNEKFGGVFPALLIAALSFSAKGVFSLFHWCISLLAFLSYKFLVVTGFAYTNLESRSREFILLS